MFVCVCIYIYIYIYIHIYKTPNIYKPAVSVCSDPVSTYIYIQNDYLLSLQVNLKTNTIFTNNERSAPPAELFNLHILLLKFLNKKEIKPYKSKSDLKRMTIF